jgi:chromosome segregation ATPase
VHSSIRHDGTLRLQERKRFLTDLQQLRSLRSEEAAREGSVMQQLERALTEKENACEDAQQALTLAQAEQLDLQQQLSKAKQEQADATEQLKEAQQQYARVQRSMDDANAELEAASCSACELKARVDAAQVGTVLALRLAPALHAWCVDETFTCVADTADVYH